MKLQNSGDTIPNSLSLVLAQDSLAVYLIQATLLDNSPHVKNEVWYLLIPDKTDYR